MARVTVKTLAEAVGVSPSTVSNAYNRPDQLSPELRSRILATAAALGYAGPDAVARSLRSGQAGAVGVLLTERLSYAFSDPYAIGFLAGLSEVVEQRRVSVVLMPLGFDNGEPDVTAVRQANIDAMTLLCISNTHPAAQVARSRHPAGAAPPPTRPGHRLGGHRRRRGGRDGRAPSGGPRAPACGGRRRHLRSGGNGRHRARPRPDHLHRLRRPAARAGRGPRRRLRSPRVDTTRSSRESRPARPAGFADPTDRHRRTQRRSGPRCAARAGLRRAVPPRGRVGGGLRRRAGGRRGRPDHGAPTHPGEGPPGRRATARPGSGERQILLPIELVARRTTGRPRAV